MPNYDLNTLEGCELQYRAFDIRYQLLRRIGVDEPVRREKEWVAERINELLASGMEEYERRCSRCGIPLPFDWPYRSCAVCRERY